MHIHSVIVSYKRKELTKQTLDSYLATVSIPHSIVIVDNGSPSDTTEFLCSLGVPIYFLHLNYFPGYAVNRGWELMPSETTYLHRIDNDTEFLPGWCEGVVKNFKDPLLGQYGLLAEGGMEWLVKEKVYPGPWSGWPVGGACVISRKIYDEGLRYSEKPWTAGGILEDNQMTIDVWARGYKRLFATKPAMRYLCGDYPEYDQEIKKSRFL